MTGKNALVAVAVIAIGAAVTATSLYFRRDKTVVVTTEVIRSRDLEAVVSASGKIQPKRLVNISADTPGRVVDLAVNEGDRIKKGQFLLQIDPQEAQANVQRAEAALSAAKASSAQAKASLIQAQKSYERSLEIKKVNAQLISDEQLEQLRSLGYVK